MVPDVPEKENRIGNIIDNKRGRNTACKVMPLRTSLKDLSGDMCTYIYTYIVQVPNPVLHNHCRGRGRVKRSM